MYLFVLCSVLRVACVSHACLVRVVFQHLNADISAGESSRCRACKVHWWNMLVTFLVLKFYFIKFQKEKKNKFSPPPSK